MKKYIIVCVSVILLLSCNNSTQKKTGSIEVDQFNIEELKPIIIENGRNWSIGLKSKNVDIISNNYDRNAHYLPNNDMVIHGIENITAYWKASLDFVNDIQLTMETLEGTKELLYETGTGIALLPNEIGSIDTLAFKYVNVWKLQKDGSYKAVIDIFNNMKP